MKAYVLVETNAGKTKAVKRALGKLKPGKCRIDSLDVVTGPFDYIAVVQGPTLDDIGQLVTEGIGAIEGRHAHDDLSRGVDRMTRRARLLIGLLAGLAALGGADAWAQAPQAPRPQYLPFAEFAVRRLRPAGLRQAGL